MKAGVRVPKPIAFRKNVLVMEFIGNKGIPALTAKRNLPENPVQWYKKIIKSIELLYKKENLIHADLSEYNVLNNEQEPVIIDMGQAVIKEHPMAMEFLARDIQRINKWFKKQGVRTMTDDKAMEMVLEK